MKDKRRESEDDMTESLWSGVEEEEDKFVKTFVRGRHRDREKVRKRQGNCMNPWKAIFNFRTK